MILLFIQAFCNDTSSLVVVGGSVVASGPLVLVLAWASGSGTFHAVVVFCLFVFVIIALDLAELCLK